MKIDMNSEKPIFIQIAEGVEDGILTGMFPEEEQIPSITEFSVNYKINPATALKGINSSHFENPLSTMAIISSPVMPSRLASSINLLI